ncbi:hypothetical protein GQ53DRAFT_817038 [Thozetella sp. PMI_491]|nr:hypothetical protein GQ53DRAFT_817038 [Thozetella sp. PMI_491]
MLPMRSAPLKFRTNNTQAVTFAMTPKRSERTTARRKAQNAASQRLYRSKQKERLQQIERAAILAVAGQGPEVSLLTARQQLSQDLARAERPHAHRPALSIASSDIYQFFHALETRKERENLLFITEEEQFGLRDVLKYGLIVSGSCMDPKLFELATLLPASAWLDMVKTSVGDVDIKAAFVAGMSLFATLEGGKFSSLSAGPISRMGEPSLREWAQAASQPLPLTGDLTFSIMSWGRALRENAQHLHISVEDWLSDSALSQFALGGTRTPESKTPPDDSDRNIKPDLVPTAAQRSLPHHPCFDLLPWPVFRTKAIIACSMDPPLVDEDDLCLDLMNDAFRCWGSGVTSMHGRGQGTPWDSRSWEVAPWFLEKWKVLTDGPSGDMWRTSAWWRSMRSIEP